MSMDPENGEVGRHHGAHEREKGGFSPAIGC